MPRASAALSQLLLISCAAWLSTSSRPFQLLQNSGLLLPSPLVHLSSHVGHTQPGGTHGPPGHTWSQMCHTCTSEHHQGPLVPNGPPALIGTQQSEFDRGSLWPGLAVTL